jgi:hypothetical protein
VWTYPVASPNHPSFSVPNIEREFEKEIEEDSLAAGAVFGIVVGVLLTSCIFITAFCMMRKRGGSSSPKPAPVVTNEIHSVTDSEAGDAAFI